VSLLAIPSFPVLLEAAQNTQHFASLLSLYTGCLHSQSDAVLEAAITTLKPVHSVIPSHFNEAILPLLTPLLRSISPSNRLHLLSQFEWIQAAIPTPLFLETIFPHLNSLIQENNPEVSEVITPIVVSLMKTNPAEATPSLLALLAQHNTTIRFYCIQHYHPALTSEPVLTDLVFS
ncbi:hypothetical protein WA556_002990, partial [Blastocystis sp. ATCC 50177/Nand II]